MEFKSNKHRGKKTKPSFSSDAPSSHSQTTPNHLAAEDKEWDQLLSKVEEDQNRKNRKLNPFSKKNSAFDKPPEEDLRKVEVNIKLSLPKVDVARFKGVRKVLAPFSRALDRLKKIRPTKRNIAIGSVALILIVAGIVVGNKYLFGDKNSGAEVAGTSKVTKEEVPEPTNDPTFAIAKPQGRELPKEKIIFDPKRKFAKFEDDINGIPISVSQQPIPDGIKSDPVAGTTKLAKDFGAAEEITVDGTKINYGQDEKGQQTVILTKNGLLIFILTSAQTDKEGLKIYAGNLN